MYSEFSIPEFHLIYATFIEKMLILAHGFLAIHRKEIFFVLVNLHAKSKFLDVFAEHFRSAYMCVGVFSFQF